MGVTMRLQASRTEASARSTLARSRSSRLSTTSFGRPSASASCQTFSVCTSAPDTASITTTAASATRSAARASLRKFAIPGVSIRLTLVLFHSHQARLAERVCLRAISSSSESVTVVPSSTLPKRFTAPASKRRAAANCVLPDPLCPTRATFRTLAAS